MNFTRIPALVLALLTLTFSNVGTADSNSVYFDASVHENHLVDVKFDDGHEIRARAGRLEAHDGWSQSLDVVTEASMALPGSRWEPLHDVGFETLEGLRQRAAARGRQVPDINLYFRVELLAGTSAPEAVAALQSIRGVQGAYAVPRPVQPPLPPDYETSNDSNFDDATNLNLYQRYLDPAPDGLDVRYEWDGAGGSGSGIAVCDVEYGFSPHADLPGITILGGVVDPTLPIDFYDHGTAVLGILGSLDNGWGTTGMVHDAEFYLSPVKLVFSSFNVAAAVTRCAAQLSAGDVILIEQQTGGQNGEFVPMEWNKPTYDAIVLAVANGIVVVEAAGNGDENLDDPFYATAQPGHAPFLSANDSGAIIVGGGQSPWSSPPRSKTNDSTFGGTVDLQGWGQHVVAPGYGFLYDDEGTSFNYTLFGGTSSASPLVAAAAAIVQFNYILKDGAPGTPAEVRSLLRSTGTPQANPGSGIIGPQPDLRAAIEQLWDIPPPAAPVVTPAAGAYPMPLQIAIGYGSASQNSSNTNIRYTLDGSDPDEDSFIFVPEFGDTLYINYGAEVRARAYVAVPGAGRAFATPVTSSVYSSTTPKVETPVISPDGGFFNQTQSFVINTATPGATIRYRTDGRAPSFFYPGTEYTGPFSLAPGTYTIVARGYRDGYYKSDAAYSDQITVTPITLPTPTIYPSSGSYNGSVTVYIGSTVLGATIRYTTDGSDPDSSSPAFSEPLDFTAATTVKARIYLDGYSPSDVVSQSYTVITQAAAPSFQPASGSSATGNLNVTLSTTTPGATIRYTTNGAEPTIYSSFYSGPLSLGVGLHTIKAKAFVAGGSPSATSTATYTVYDPGSDVDPPTVTPPGGIFNSPITVTMTSNTEGADFIFYTTDASDPETSPTVQPYSGPFALEAGQYFIRARAFKSGVGNSNMTSANLTVVDASLGPPATPTIDPDGGLFTNPVSVTVTAPDFSSPFNIRNLYVTNDGTDPLADFTSPGVGSGGVYTTTLSTPQTLKTLSAQQGWFDSTIASAEFLFQCATPTITEGGTFLDSATVEISTTTTGATIYYTIDGSEPSTSSPTYDAPFELGVGDHPVKAWCTRNDFINSLTAVSAFVVEATPVAPEIAAQPQNVTVDSCETAFFSVSATGTEVLEYQWYLDGVPIAEAVEPELEVAAAIPQNEGQYTITVTNDGGSVTSDPATLTVIDIGDDCAALNARVFKDRFEASDS